MLTRLLGPAAAALLLLPGAAHAAVLTPLKPCYISATQRDREAIDLGGSGFRPNALIDVSLDGKLDSTIQADANGNLPPQVLKSPYQDRGQRTFTVTAAEQGNPLNSVSLSSLTTALALRLRPREADSQTRIRLRGRGFTEQQPVWGHYLFGGHLRKTVRLVPMIDTPCGTFSVRRRQIPIKRPRAGAWTLQIDQQKRYSRAPESALIRVKITVFTPPR